MSPQVLECVQHLLGRVWLSYDAKIVFHRQHFGHAGAEDRLMVGNDNVDHTDNSALTWTMGTHGEQLRNHAAGTTIISAQANSLFPAAKSIPHVIAR